MLNRNLMMLRQSLASPIASRSLLTGITKRNFSNSTSSVNNTPAMMMACLGLGGLAYVSYTCSELSGGQRASLARRETLISNFVQTRLAQTFGWFGYGIMTTSGFVYYMRNSMAWARMNPYMMLGASIACMFGTHALPYDTMMIPKIGMYTAFSGLIGMSLLPLIQVSAAATVADAALVTGLSMFGLGAVAYNAPSEQFLNWGQPLAFACMGMLGISLLSMWRPQSKAVFNIWLYGGLALAGALTMYRT